MRAQYLHTNFNVSDLDKSLGFYQKALGLQETRRIHGPDGSFIIVFLGDGTTDALLELTWLNDHPQPYDLGECEFHIAYRVEDKAAAHALHEQHRNGPVFYPRPRRLLDRDFGPIARTTQTPPEGTFIGFPPGAFLLERKICFFPWGF